MVTVTSFVYPYGRTYSIYKYSIYHYHATRKHGAESLSAMVTPEVNDRMEKAHALGQAVAASDLSWSC